MKCSAIQECIVPYVAGALCVADELCVDIHLVQCAVCREEVDELVNGVLVFPVELEHPDPRNLLQDLLEELEGLPEPPPVSRRVNRWRRNACAALLPLTVVVTFSLFYLSGAVPDWTRNFNAYLSLPTVEEDMDIPMSKVWRPWMGGTGPLADMEEIKILLHPAVSRGAL